MCNTFNYLRGGADRCFLDMIALFEQQGHEVIPFCMHHEKNQSSPYEKYFVSLKKLLNTIKKELLVT